MRSKAFFINGGAGRVICSVPAFEKYAETHDDFIIVCEGGTDFFKGHPTLSDKVFDNWHKGLFEKEIQHRDCVSPEPYRCWHYYNQKCSLAQAFDILINELDEPRELPKPTVVLSKAEIVQGFNIIEEVKAGTKKDKVLIVQPFGRSVEQVGQDFIIDTTSRSFSLNNIVTIINELKKDYAVVIMSEIHFPLEENEDKARYKVARPQIDDQRIWASVINAADHFLGCDSMGQHIARAFDKTATIVTGSTCPVNISYPDHKDFDVIDVGEGRRIYSPIRISIDEVRDRLNDEAMEMTKEQMNSVVASVKKRMGKSAAYTGNFVPQAQDYGSSCCPPSNVQQEVKGLPQLDTKKFGGTTKGFGKPSESNVDILQKLK